MADPTDYPEDASPEVEKHVDHEPPARETPSELDPDDELAEENAATSLDQPSDNVE